MIVVWVLSGYLWSQSPIAPSPSPALTEPFAAIGESLASKADTLLVRVDRPVPPVLQETLDHGAYDTDFDQRKTIRLKRGGLSSAATRVELLRPTIDPILVGEGVPVELAAVVLVESAGNPAALSPKGARGLWQLMPETARRYGLVVNSVRDERVDVEKSTHAAARYLSDLHLQFGSWPLALAAYNTGEQNLQRAIDRSLSVEFGVLSSSGVLPLETRNYVPAVLAATQLFGQSYGLKAALPVLPAIKIFAVSSR